MNTSHEEKAFPTLTNEQSVNLGWAHTQSTAPINSYIHFSSKKPEGTIRIGVFGDSFVQGVEAELGFDFASFLQGTYKENGYDNIEVINFGVHSYGVHQAFLLWKYAGQSYELDYTIFMPLQFHRKRDRSFVFLYNHFAPVHARYILVDKQLQLLPVVGETRAKAGEHYNSIFSSIKYVRYDEKPPAFLRALVPMSRTLTHNPFYYRNDEPNKEILTTYALLFQELANSDTTSIVICNSKIICDIENKIAGKSPMFLKSQIPKYIADAPLLYTAPRTHLSAFGNQLRSDELFSFLVKDEKQELKVIQIDANSTPPYIPSQEPPLYESETIGIELQGHQVATFMTHRTGEPRWTFDEVLDFQKDKIASLLRITNDKSLRMIPTTSILIDQEPVFLLFELDNKPIRLPIGIVHASSPYIGTIELFGRDVNECLSIKQSKGQVCFGQSDWTQVNFEAQGTIHNVEVVIGKRNEIILHAKANGVKGQFIQLIKKWLGKNVMERVQLNPSTSKFSMPRAVKGQFLSINDITNQQGTIDLVTRSPKGEVFHHQMIPYKILQVQ
ncbi:MAG: hypothetical protein ACPGYT_07040 [Nitrospirales bacterium]